MTERAAPTRETLLDAAERLFAEKGYSGVGVRELAAAAGANLASIQYHFGSKRELYLATVTRAMERQGGRGAFELLERRPDDASEAARLLVRFARRFLDALLAEPSLSTCGLFMLREAMRPSEAIDAVVTRFTRPHQELLVTLMAVLLPDASAREHELAAHCLLGQLLHYMIQRAFLERQSEIDLADARAVRAVADYVARLTLRGLELPAELVERALEEPADEGPRPGTPPRAGERQGE